MSKKKTVIGVSLFILALVVIIGVSYAFWKLTRVQEDENVITSGCFKIEFTDTEGINLQEAYPISDAKGLEQTPYSFTIQNICNNTSSYQINLETITQPEGTKVLPEQYIRVDLEETSSLINTKLTSDIETSTTIDNALKAYKLYEDTLTPNQSKTYKLRAWMDKDTPAIDEVMEATFKAKISIDFNFNEEEEKVAYKEAILNGTDPVLASNLIPVTIEEDGTVLKADTSSEWYSYGNKRWANAVILEDETKIYDEYEEIPEEEIESYFVWIPRYKYKIWDLGNYTSATTINTGKVHTIDIVFENKNAEASTGSTVGSYLTHPAFTAFDTNGIWVAKFETGYKGATSTTSAEVNSSESNKIEVKPNVYSWRNISVGNAFKVSYDYKRELESHMMKNTEWGAVAYLQHSAYGSATSVRINNNSAYITGYAATEEPTEGYSATSIEGNRNESTALKANGTYTMMYNTSTGYHASTTGNITGVYDMSGGTWEYVMGYNTSATKIGGESGLISLYSDFFTNTNWNKYYDKYSSTKNTDYNKRILGDATGEMGPFQETKDSDGITRQRSSWYEDYAPFVDATYPWFIRGGDWSVGIRAGSFAFSYGQGAAYNYNSFRIVLAP